MDEYTCKRLLSEAEICAIEYDLVLSEISNRLEEDTNVSKETKSFINLQLVEANRNLKALKNLIPEMFTQLGESI